MSLKAALAEYKELNTASAYRAARSFVRTRTAELMQELKDDGFVDEAGLLTTSTKPFNVFARLASGATPLPAHMVEENRCLEESGHASSLAVAANLPAADAEWGSTSPEWLGKASMSKHHRFLLTRDLSWWWFNALVFGLDSPEQLVEAVRVVEAMVEAGRHYTRSQGWSSNVGFYFHLYGKSSVNSLHMHMVDLNCTGPSYDYQRHKNLPVDDVLLVLHEELRAANPAESSRSDYCRLL